jgi:hypothetical protein
VAGDAIIPECLSEAARSAARFMPGYTAADSREGPLRYEHDLAGDAPLPEQLVRVSGLGKRKSLRDQGLDLSLLKEIEQRHQIPSKPGLSRFNHWML